MSGDLTHLLPVVISLAAAATVKAQDEASPEEIMRRNDINEDGVIRRAEAEQAGTPLAEMFDRVDTDGDGRITMEELRAIERD